MIETKSITPDKATESLLTPGAPAPEISTTSLGRVSDLLMGGTLVVSLVAVLEISVPAIILAAVTGFAAAALKLAISRH